MCARGRLVFPGQCSKRPAWAHGASKELNLVNHVIPIVKLILDKTADIVNRDAISGETLGGAMMGMSMKNNRYAMPFHCTGGCLENGDAKSDMSFPEFPEN